MLPLNLGTIVKIFIDSEKKKSQEADTKHQAISGLDIIASFYVFELM